MAATVTDTDYLRDDIAYLERAIRSADNAQLDGRCTDPHALARSQKRRREQLADLRYRLAAAGVIERMGQAA